MSTAIIGAGPSGLALNLFLEEKAEIFEASDHVGGHASTFAIDGFTFDYGPHIMFSRDPAILDFMVASLGRNIHRCTRNNKISFKNRLIKYPFENDLKSLPLEDNFDCLYHFLVNPYKERYAEPRNLKEWLLKTFGEGICRHYLFPYNEKVWNIPVDDLSMLWAERIPNPPVADVVKSALGYSTEGYLHQLHYHYPLAGGYQAISESWARPGNIRFNMPITKIRKVGRQFLVSSGSDERLFDRVISTMPIQHLVEAVDFEVPSEIRRAVDALIVNPMYVVSIGLKGEDPNRFTAIYFPEPGYLVNRVSYPSTFSPKNAPAGHYSLQAEITCRKQSDQWGWSDGKIAEHVVEGLFSRGLIPRREDIVLSDVRRRDFSYVVYDRDYVSNTALIRSFFESQGISLLGRFGYFEYINVDQAVARALELAAKLNGDALDSVRLEYLERGLKQLGL